MPTIDNPALLPLNSETLPAPETPPGDKKPHTRTTAKSPQKSLEHDTRDLRCFAYRRLSLASKGNSLGEPDSAGLQAQLDACQEWADRQKFTINKIFTDNGISGATPLHLRPALVELLAELRRGDVVVVAKRDRLGRDVFLVATIEREIAKKKAYLVSAAGEGSGDSPQDALMRTLIDGFAQFERAQIRGRVSAAMQAKKKRNEFLGTVPYGSQLSADGVHLEENPDEQRIIAAARRLRKEGRSLRNVADLLAKRGLTARNGEPFLSEQIRRMLEVKK